MGMQLTQSIALIGAVAAMGLGQSLTSPRAQERDERKTTTPQLENPTLQRRQQPQQQPQVDPEVLQQPELFEQLPQLTPQPEQSDGPERTEIARNDLPEWLARTPLVRQVANAFFAVERPRREPIATEDMDLLPQVRGEDGQLREDLDEEPPSLNELKRQKRRVDFEFYDFRSGQSFQVLAPRGNLAEFARQLHDRVDETDPQGEPIPEMMIEEENRQEQAWSDRIDNRIRRGIADGWPDTSSIYQRMADYGGCSANVLLANNNRMIAITAAHCVFTGSGVSNAKLRPRRDRGESPTWGSWSVYGWGYYPQFLNNDCENNFTGGCIRHDIALVFASPDRGATPPKSMGWAYRPKSFLNSHLAYRRGYPGCGYPHSPSGCTGNMLYGDGDVFNRFFKHPDSDGWNRQFKFSSDINPGDSGSGLYYYRDGFPYVYGVTSAERLCKQNCKARTPNFGRRITAEFFDFINSVR